jgi:hypothetical protein
MTSILALGMDRPARQVAARARAVPRGTLGRGAIRAPPRVVPVEVGQPAERGARVGAEPPAEARAQVARAQAEAQAQVAAAPAEARAQVAARAPVGSPARVVLPVARVRVDVAEAAPQAMVVLPGPRAPVGEAALPAVREPVAKPAPEEMPAREAKQAAQVPRWMADRETDRRATAETTTAETTTARPATAAGAADKNRLPTHSVGV